MSVTFDFAGVDALDDGADVVPLPVGVGVTVLDVGGGWLPVPSALPVPGGGEVIGALFDPLDECCGDASPTAQALRASSSAAAAASTVTARDPARRVGRS